MCVTATVTHVFVSFLAVQIHDLPHIHLYNLYSLRCYSLSPNLRVTSLPIRTKRNPTLCGMVLFFWILSKISHGHMKSLTGAFSINKVVVKICHELLCGIVTNCPQRSENRTSTSAQKSPYNANHTFS